MINGIRLTDSGSGCCQGVLFQEEANLQKPMNAQLVISTVAKYLE
jgi:hypothetical protein